MAKLQVLRDGKAIAVKNGITLVWRDLLIPGVKPLCQLHVKATSEGLVHDVWVMDEPKHPYLLATKSQMAQEIADEISEMD